MGASAFGGFIRLLLRAFHVVILTGLVTQSQSCDAVRRAGRSTKGADRFRLDYKRPFAVRNQLRKDLYGESWQGEDKREKGGEGRKNWTVLKCFEIPLKVRLIASSYVYNCFSSPSVPWARKKLFHQCSIEPLAPSVPFSDLGGR